MPFITVENLSKTYRRGLAGPGRAVRALDGVSLAVLERDELEIITIGDVRLDASRQPAGRFTPEQRDVYEIVLAAQRAAIENVKPGKHWNEPHDAAVRVLTDGLVQLKLLKKGSVDAHIEDGSYKRRKPARGEEPFFYVFHIYEPHAPYAPPEPLSNFPPACRRVNTISTTLTPSIFSTPARAADSCSSPVVSSVRS